MENFLTTLDTNLGYDDERERVDRKAIEKMVNSLELNVNCFGFNPEEIYTDFEGTKEEGAYGKEAECRYAEQRLFRLALYWINFWGSLKTYNEATDYGTQNYYLSVDDRNEATVRKSKYITGQPEFQKLLKFYTEELDYNNDSQDISAVGQFYKNFMKTVNHRMHKTNIQTATKLMLYSLSRVSDKDAKKLVENLKEEYGERYYTLPLI